MRSLVSKVQSVSVVKAANTFVDINPGSYTTEGNGMWMFGQNGIDHFFSYTDHHSCVKAYKNCPPIAAIVNRMSQAYINGKTWVLNSKGKEATSNYATNLRKLLRRPNLLQTWKQFEAQAHCYKKLFGFTLILVIKPAGYKEAIDASALWNIPPFMLDIKETNKIFYQTTLGGVIEYIKLNYKGETSTLNLENVFILKDTVPSFSNMIFPESRIVALEKPINNIIGAYESRNTLINFRGAQGFLSQEKDGVSGVPILDGEKKKLQEDFRRYGLRNGQWQVIISNSLLRWQQMGYPTKDLMLMEEVQESSMACCDGYNFPPHLLGLLDPTYNNQNAAEKGLYQNCIMPDAENDYEQWNELFKTADYSLRLDKDFSHITVLQPDKKMAADARGSLNSALEKEWRNGMITLNDWRLKNGEDPITEGPDKERFTIYFPEYVEKYGDPMKGTVTTVNNNPNGNEQQQTGQSGSDQPAQ